MIVVTSNYRLGPFGFLVSPDGRGNYALEDQRLVLTWIRDNIANFGGDPTNVTMYVAKDCEHVIGVRVKRRNGWKGGKRGKEVEKARTLAQSEKAGMDGRATSVEMNEKQVKNVRTRQAPARPLRPSCVPPYPRPWSPSLVAPPSSMLCVRPFVPPRPGLARARAR